MIAERMAIMPVFLRARRTGAMWRAFARRQKFAALLDKALR
jgi:hypothetical protein